MSKLLKWVARLPGMLFAPLQKNGAFFVFMYALGYYCTQTEVTLHLKGAVPYELAAIELFLDIYIVCALLALLPKKLRWWVRGCLYIVFYGVALADMYCYVRLESTLTPTMLMLVGETNRREAAEFLGDYLKWDLLMSPIGGILLILLAHLLWTVIRHWSARLARRSMLPSLNSNMVSGFRSLLGIGVIWLLATAVDQCWENKMAMCRMFSYKTIGEVEYGATQKEKATFYLPVYRLAFALYANNLASHQTETLTHSEAEIQVDSCSFRIPNIVLVIGESYNKHHSQLYGYNMPTTPRQKKMAEQGELAVFTDVVSPWNLTSYVFKNMMSVQAVGDSGEWCDKPLFPAIFRKAGYHVTFITNQFQSKAGEQLYDFSGGFFLNEKEQSQILFDTRNKETHRYDSGVLADYDKLQEENTDYNLIILHLMGSHSMYMARYPQKTRKHLLSHMYDRPDLTEKQRLVVADYDNSLLYNDSIVWAITRRFTDKDAVVIYMPDHGEEIYNGEPYTYGRLHSAKTDYRLAREEFEIPFWIWGSPVYRERHPYNWQSIVSARQRPFMIDVLSHLLLYLGGISTPYYRDELNVISPQYNEARPRLLKADTDYNQLRKQE